MSLRLKMILGIGVILLSVTLVYSLIALKSQAKDREDLALHHTDLLAAMADRFLTSAMGFGETEIIRAILARIGEQNVSAGIRVVAAGGRRRLPSRADARLHSRTRALLRKPELSRTGGGAC